MSRFFSEKFSALEPYTPGEQLNDRRYIKLNTNESAFPPSPKAQAYAKAEAEQLRLYSDPTASALCRALARNLGVAEDEVLPTNGSDEILNFAFMAFCDAAHPAAFADITYGFYPVYANLYNIPTTILPLKDDFSIDPHDYIGIHKTIFIANPNAPTGLALSRDTIEEIIRSNPDNIVCIDEAYVDFGAESCVPLIHKYDNLFVTQTFSKSYSLAGGRLGVGIGCKALISDLNTIKYSTNPYNINRMTMAAGIGALEDVEIMRQNCKTIEENRTFLTDGLRSLGFILNDSLTNFVFAKHRQLSGKEVYEGLRSHGILVRHFDKPRISDYNRITVGTKEQMQTLLQVLGEIL